MPNRVTRIDSGRHRNPVDLAAQANSAEERLAAYRAALQPADAVQDALVETMSATLTRLRELPDSALDEAEEVALRDAFHASMKALRTLQRLERGGPGPAGARKAA